jgi:uncharacterized coiled-coil protein SlyX
LRTKARRPGRLSTVEHIERLEKKIEALELKLTTQETKVRRLETYINKVRGDVHRQHNALGQITRDVDNKIDRRDYE